MSFYKKAKPSYDYNGNGNDDDFKFLMPFPEKNYDVQTIIDYMTDETIEFPYNMFFSVDFEKNEAEIIEEFKKIDAISNKNFIDVGLCLEKYPDISTNIFCIYGCSNLCGKTNYYQYSSGSNVRKYLCFHCATLFPDVKYRFALSMFPDIYIKNSHKITNKTLITQISKKIERTMRLHFYNLYNSRNVSFLDQARCAVTNYNKIHIYKFPSLIHYNNAKISLIIRSEHDTHIKMCDKKIDGLNNDIAKLISELNEHVGPAKANILMKKLQSKFPSMNLLQVPPAPPAPPAPQAPQAPQAPPAPPAPPALPALPAPVRLYIKKNIIVPKYM